MIAPPKPPDESERLQELEELYLIDTPAEERFDRITRLAQSLFNVPIALITLVGEERVWIKSSQGLSALEIPREISFCAFAILGPDAMVVPDSRLDPRFKDNPFVKNEPHVIFYAGQPLVGPKGHRVGTLCLIDHKPREFGNKDLQNLKDLAAFAEFELRVEHINETHKKLFLERNKLRSQALVDSLTRLWNRGAILEILEMECGRAKRKDHSVGLMMIDLDHFKKINDTYGHPVGDVVLLEVAYRIRSNLRTTDAAGRYGGEEFLVVLPEVDLVLANEIAERIRSSFVRDNILTPRGIISITCSLGVGIIPKNKKISTESVIAQVDSALYKAKNEGRNRFFVCELE